MSLITSTQVAQFHALGYFITKPAFTEPELHTIRTEFERLHEDAIRQAEQTDDPKRLDLTRYRPFIGQAHTKSDLLARFVKAPIYLEACEKFIGPNADLYYNQIVIKPPELGRSFAWHQDSGYTETDPLEYITCWTAISRTFVENGCIWIIPGSHKQGLQKHTRDEENSELVASFTGEENAIPVEMAPGQIAIFSSLMLHKSGANTSGEVRHGYVPQYHHPGVIRVNTGEPFGDRYPVLRNGNPV